MTTALTRPTLDLFDSWVEAVTEFGGAHVDGAGLALGASADRETCRALIAKAEAQADTSQALPAGLVHNDLYWLTDDGEVVGFVSFRHELNDYQSTGTRSFAATGSRCSRTRHQSRLRRPSRRYRCGSAILRA